MLMGGSINPQTDDPEFATDPRHEFNFWFDPEAAHIVLRADWPRIDVTTVDVSIKAPFTQADAGRDCEIADAGGALHRRMEPGPLLHVGRTGGLRVARSRRSSPKRSGLHGRGPEPRAELRRHADMERSNEAGHRVRLVHAQMDLDLPRFQKMFVELMNR